MGRASLQEIRQRLEPLGLEAAGSKVGNGPASEYRLRDGVGKIGFISPVGDAFCNRCNRLRLTADGKLKTCLFSDEEMDLKDLLRSHCPDDVLERKLCEAISHKPLRHGFLTRALKRCHRPMVKIGG